MLSLRKKNAILCFAVLFALSLILVSPRVSAADDPLSFFNKDDVDAKADKLEFVGSNIVARGHVFIRYKEYTVRADRIILNPSSKDIEAEGHAQLIRRGKSQQEIDVEELKKIQKNPNVKVIIEGYVTKPSGKQRLLVTLITESMAWEGERFSGNLSSGIFDLGKYKGVSGPYYIEGEKAEREADGSITIHDVRMSTCEYLEENHDHYSIYASKVRLIPSEGFADLTNPGSRDFGRYSLWAYGCTFYIGNVPVLWVPVVHKPSDDSGIGVQMRWGKDDDWGYFVQTKKKFILMNDPLVETSILLDYYSKRGPGGGIKTEVTSEKTKTDAFIYGLYDQEPYKEAATGQRFDIPNGRYDLKLSHLNHITPRMDFRGQIEKLSDINFLDDFFQKKYDSDPQPPTFGSLEYQFDHFSASVNYRQRINSFFTEVERLPEFRLDTPRQELFSNIYYQGETSLGYFSMKWRDFNKERTLGNMVDPKNYKSGRYDTLNMFYYPFKIDWLNVLPRAGFRLTYYSKTSKGEVSPGDLNTMLNVDNPSGTQVGGTVVNYDDKGGGKLRFTGETGIEMDTKIYRSWNNVKSAFWDIDGIRHVMVPYVNYNFIPNPTVSRDHLYYFDDIDRITEQNFVRLGLKNRLQTRRGEFNSQDIFTWASLENYWDYHFDKERKADGGTFKGLGDFGTLLEANPMDNLHLTSNLLIGTGDFNINKFTAGLTYDITEDWKVHLNYNYQKNYDQRSTYSMGSSLTDIMSGSAFSSSYSKFQDVSFGIDFPIMDKTRGELELIYDMDNKMMNDSKLRIIRTFHCWEMALEYGLKQQNNDQDSKENKQSFSFMFYLTAAPSAKITARQSRDDGGE